MEISSKLSKEQYYRSSKQSLETICVFIKYVYIINMLCRRSAGFAGMVLSSLSGWLGNVSSLSKEML